MKVLQVSPTYFSKNSCLGGGERYAMELARQVSKKVETKFVSFGKKRESFKLDNLSVEIFPFWFLLNGSLENPVTPMFFREIFWADIVHCHQIYTMPTSFALMTAKIFGKKFFATHSGSHQKNLINKMRLWGKIDGFLLLSQFSANLLQSPKEKTAIIYGGVDTEKFRPAINPDRGYILCVSRLVPHKGINYLIEAINNNVPLKIAGTESDPEYLNYLKQLAQGKNVEFIFNASDEEIVKLYQNALLGVQPSVYSDYQGKKYQDPELLGLTTLESMACGTPVLVTNVGSLPELINNKVGFIVEPSDPAQIRQVIDSVVNNRKGAERMGQAGREHVIQNFTWDKTVNKCLSAYEGIF